jgi:hypothetical protein
MAGQESVGRASSMSELSTSHWDRTAPVAGFMEGVPRQQVQTLLVKFILKAESSLALNGPCQPASGPSIGDRLGEVRHVFVTTA